MKEDADEGPDSLRLYGLKVLGEVLTGDDLGRLIFESQRKREIPFEDGDLYVVAQKVVSKSEGMYVKVEDVTPTPFAVSLAAFLKKDPKEVEVVLRESKSIVRARLGILITENKQGIICANSGVDRSNVKEEGRLLLLPENPDRSAARVRRSLEALSGKKCAVVISDTYGRPWREGQVDFAIGASGIACFRDYRGKPDMYGRPLKVTNIAQVDELASAAELIMGKSRGTPVVLVKGFPFEGGEGSKALLRKISRDLFR
ncbi:MAG TPA: coenzyme F420-0:L-glutamate ligase [Conexivisphaerales archaeon]|nr:coenzyme F420-0:L-glutamate ligase [Conexivisphaerales archaeon]